MTASLVGRTAVVTAAAQGIGRASAEALARAGANVYATDKLANLLGTLGVRTAPLDVLWPTAIGDFGEGFPDGVDILFNCAGVVRSGAMLDCSVAEWAFALDLNVTAMDRMVRAFLPGMIRRGGGSVINMSSVASSVKGVPNRFAYQASKAAVVGLTKSVAIDYVGKGVRCNAIRPGAVESPSRQGRLSATGDFETARAAFVARQPMGRIGLPEEIAELAVYLAGATYTTGQIHVIDGGWTA